MIPARDRGKQTLVDPGRHLHGPVRADARLDRDQRRAAGYRPQPRRLDRRSAVGRERIPAGAGVVRRQRRPTRRHRRTPAGVRARHGSVCGRLGGGRAVGLGGGADRRAHPAGDRRRRPPRTVARDRLDRLPGGRARSRARYLDRGVGARAGHRTAGRRRAGRRGQLALAVLAQPALLPARRGACARVDRRATRRDRRVPDRHPRRRDRGAGAGSDRDRARRGQGVGLDLGRHARLVRDGRSAAGRVLVHRAPRPLADRRVRPVPQRPLLRGQRGRLLPGRLLLGPHVPAAAVPADRPRPQRAGSRRADPAGHGADDRDLAAGRAASSGVSASAR